MRVARGPHILRLWARLPGWEVTRVRWEAMSKWMKGALLSAALLSSGACSTAGGWYSDGDTVNGEFSAWKSVGAVALGVLTLGAIGAGAYAASTAPTTHYYSGQPVIVKDGWGRAYCRNSATGDYILASYCGG